ncbi:FecR domain-containing protein [uncultured Chitinophaga sp.]|jgi:Fe2+-dicitrate sensor, membrane component|uniref:FecR family protein n=1 Tax=uncultured Chitinophaga sp. TaxID=339340 RepID=UPI002607C603|nr:FecR domain-containing protein [uncultured Chitinophaga sp.]
MSKDRIWILLGKQLSGDIAAAEQAELEALLKEDPEAAASGELAASIWQTPLQDVNAADGHQERIWETLSPQLQQRRHTPIVRRLVTAAAAAAVLAATWAGWILLRPTAPVLQQLSSAPGGKSKVALPDGSIVWLNRNTRLYYEKNGFGKQHREITLNGEAFFDIARSEGVPFIIHAGEVNIRVLGTAFNVKAYAGDSAVFTTLVRGKIAVSFQEKTVVMRPEEKLTVPLSGQAGAFEQAHPQKDSSGQLPETSWLNNKLAFDNNSFGELAAMMSQWYGVTFHFESAALQQLRFSGIIDTESIDEALKMLQLSRPFRYRISGEAVYISN